MKASLTELQNVYYAQKTSFLPRWNLISSPPISPLDEPSDLEGRKRLKWSQVDNTNICGNSCPRKKRPQVDNTWRHFWWAAWSLHHTKRQKLKRVQYQSSLIYQILSGGKFLKPEQNENLINQLKQVPSPLWQTGKQGPRWTWWGGWAPPWPGERSFELILRSVTRHTSNW